MSIKKHTGMTLIAGLGMAAWLVASPVVANHSEGLTPESVAATIESAEAARQKAASIGGEWRDTGKLIGKAKKALEAGDLGKAADLAHRAEQEGAMGYQQAHKQKELRLPSYLPY
jgi:hypothetical protein